MGNGILTFLWNKGEMKKVIPDNHAYILILKKMLCEKIIYFHTHDEERKKIADIHYHHYHTHFSAERIIRYIIETTFQLPFTDDYLWQGERDNRSTYSCKMDWKTQSLPILWIAANADKKTPN